VNGVLTITSDCASAGRPRQGRSFRTGARILLPRAPADAVRGLELIMLQ